MKKIKPILTVFGLIVLLTGCVTTGSNLNKLTPTEKSAGWKLLFDGQTTEGWSPRDSARWDVGDGAIVYRPGSGAGHLCTVGSYTNFQLKVDFWADERVNSGVFLRCPSTGSISATNAYEVNIFDSHEKWPTGSVNEVARTKSDCRSVGRWSSYEITSNGDHLVVKFDGRVVVDVRDSREKFGPIGLQNFKGEGMVKFRNLKLRELR
jgi:hypothetical protein